MKKILLFLSFLLMSIGMWGAEVIYKLALFGSTYNSQGVSSYSNSWYSTNNGFRVDIENANNNNNGWNYIKMGSKNAAYIGKITTHSNIDKAITKVVLTISAILNANVNSITLYTSSNGSTWTSIGTFDKNSSGAKTVIISSPTINTFYKIEIDCKKSSNGVISISKVDYYYDNSLAATYTVTYDANGGSGTMTDTNSPYNSGATVTTLTNSFTNTGYNFTGWNTASNGSGSDYAEGATFTINANTILYAQWAEIPPEPISSGKVFELVTDINDLHNNDNIIILDANKEYAMSNVQTANNRSSSQDFRLIMNKTVAVLNETSSVQILRLGQENNHWTLYTGNGYLYAASSSANYLRTQATNNTNGQWNITIDGNTYNASIIAQGSFTHNIIRFNINSGNPIYACYNEATQTGILIYKESSFDDTYTITFKNQLGPDSIKTQTDLGEIIKLPSSMNICNKCYGNEWQLDGWVSSLDAVSPVYINDYIPTNDITLYALYKRGNTELIEIEEYKKVTSNLSDWSGDYLIAAASNKIANGQTAGTANQSIGAQNTYVDPDTHLHGDTVIDAEWGDLYNVTLEEISEGSGTYVLKTKDGKYNYRTLNDNGIDATTNKATAANYPITIEFISESDIRIKPGANATGAVFRYNPQGYFRFYKNGSQNAVYLYKKVKSKKGLATEYSTSPECDTAYITTWNTDKIYLDKSLLNITDPQDITIKDINTGEVLLNNSGLSYNSDLDAYQVPINLSSKACDKLNILTKNATDSLYMIYKVPFMVAADSYTADMIDENCDVVVLDNKTLTVSGTSSANRDLKLYPGAKLKVPTGTSYNLNSLALRRDNNTVSSLALVGDLTLNHLYFDLYVDYKDWYYVALPDEFNISNLRFTNGKSAAQREDYWIKYYDGKHRAETQSGSWKSAANDTTFMPGCGFIIGIPDNYIKKELRFEFDANRILTNEKSNKTSGNVTAWGITNPTLTPNHKGWNLIGNPYMNIYDTDFASVIRAGELIKDETSGQWNGHWLVSDTTTSKLRYAVIPSKDPEDAAAGGYKSVVLDEKPLDPFTCFFVQMGGTNENPQTLKFKVSQRRNNIVARNYQEQEEEELFLRIKIGDKKTGCFISNHFNENYEPGDDLESRYAYYQLINGYKLLYSAINDSIIENGILIHSLGGKVTLDPKVETGKFELIYILYNNEWYDLLHGDEPEVSGDFVLYGKRKVNEDIPTDIGNIKPGQGTYKFLNGNNVYINNKGKIYNVLGSGIK